MPAKEIMRKFRHGKLHSGRGKHGKKGKIVRKKSQAEAILLSQLRKEGKIPERKRTYKR